MRSCSCRSSSGSNEKEVKLRTPPPHIGRFSNSSGRASITGVLLHLSSKASNFPAHAPEVHVLDFAHVFWVQPLREGSKPNQVAEEHRDQPPLALTQVTVCRPRGDRWLRNWGSIRGSRCGSRESGRHG